MKKKSNEEKKISNINIEDIKRILDDCPDIIYKKVYIEDKEAFFIFVEGLTDIDLLQRDIIKTILAMNICQLLEERNIYNLPCNEIRLIYDLEETIDSILSDNLNLYF